MAPSEPSAMDVAKTARAAEKPASSQDTSLKETLRRQTDSPVVAATFKDLFRYATPKDLLLLTIYTISAAAAAGAILPCFPVSI